MNTVTVFLIVVAATCALGKNEEEGELFEGDIILNPDQRASLTEQQQRNSFASVRSRHWKTNGKTDKTIKYYIDPQIAGAASAISDAVGEYHAKTCLRFEKISNKPSGPHIFFTTGRGCSSPVGKRYRGNSIRLARGCWRKGTIMHEIGHSIGFFHEQSRPDRDRFVQILLANVKDRNRHNFNKYNTDRIDSLGTSYDFDSMMHYGSKFFTNNGQLTIKTVDPKYQGRIGQRRGFSAGDIKQINLMYCNGNTGGGGVPTRAPSCIDKRSSCNRWTKYCSYHSYVRANCRKTCNLC